MRLTVLLLAALLSLPAAAGEVWLRCDPPAHPGISGYRFEIDLADSATAIPEEFNVDRIEPRPTCDAVIADLPCAVHCYRVVALAGPLESPPSEPLCGVPTVESELPFPGVIAGRAWCWFDLPVPRPVLQRLDAPAADG